MIRKQIIKRSFTYRALVNAITEKERAKVQHELQDVQVIHENENIDLIFYPKISCV